MTKEKIEVISKNVEKDGTIKELLKKTMEDGSVKDVLRITSPDGTVKNLVKKAPAVSSAKKDATPVAASSAKKDATPAKKDAAPVAAASAKTEGTPATASAKKTAGKAVAGAKGKKKKIGSQDMVSAILVLAGGAASLATIMLGFEALNK